MIYKKPVFFLSLIILLQSCVSKNTYENITGFAQGTTYNMIFGNDGSINPVDLKSEVEKILHEFDMSLSLYQDSSILSRINRNEDVVPDAYFTEAFKKSTEISRLTGGDFDITISPLVRAWGFGPDSHKDFSEEKRDSLMELVGMDKVNIVNGKVEKKDLRVSLDFNAIAQGYSVDIICSFFDSKGIKSYLVEIGGEVRVKGSKGGNLWKIGIDRPEDNNFVPGNQLQAIIRLKDRALATSGNYRKFYVEDGIKYSHTIDPKTGFPAKNQLLSATILASDCATADGVATACMVKGKDEAIEFIGMHPEFDAFLVFSDDIGNFRTWMTENLREYISEPEQD
ncbi:MAG: FAD:protein FMN transferase [Bacteroidales bacterium]|nr:FAD:protein FMN transferase [Bacteroidales bacterium]